MVGISHDLGKILYLQTVLLWIATTGATIAAINSVVEVFAYKVFVLAIGGFISVIWFFRHKLKREEYDTIPGAG